MSKVDDAGLLERAREGDQEAFSRLFARYQRAIFRYGAYMAGREAGDDIVQETFLAVLQQRDRRDPPRGTVLGYLIGIARHRVLKRHAALAHALRAEPLDDDLRETTMHEAVTVLDDLARAETIETVRAAVQALPAAFREAVVLCELQELSYADAAEVMQCPIGTVRSRLHRGRTLLSAALATQSPSTTTMTTTKEPRNIHAARR
jgi:RNA polymerase sigma-70 factor (ECF subfamily)